MSGLNDQVITEFRSSPGIVRESSYSARPGGRPPEFRQPGRAGGTRVHGPGQPQRQPARHGQMPLSILARAGGRVTGGKGTARQLLHANGIRQHRKP